MVSKAVVLLAAASLVKETVAANAHRHAHLHKKDVVTEVDVVTEYTTITVDPETVPPTFVVATHSIIPTSNSTTISSTSTSSSSSNTSLAPSTTSSSTTSTTSIPTTSSTSTSVAPTTTLQTSVKASSTSSSDDLFAQVNAFFSSVTSAVASVATTVTSAGSFPALGLAYNDPSLLSVFSGTKATWQYNWAASTQGDSGFEFVPMLWGTGSDHTSSWSTDAAAAIKAGSTHLLSFNEPDYASQANLSPSEAAAGHIQYMNPFSSQAKICSPAITNSQSSGTDNVGIGWLYNFLKACNGQCAIDCAAIHWYNTANATEFLEHAKAVYEVAQVPIWVTEFAPVNADDAQIAVFLTELFTLLATGQYSFIERMAYFWVDGALTSNSALSSYGSIYAYASTS